MCNIYFHYLLLNVWGVKKRNEWLHPTRFPVSFLQEDCNCHADARVVSRLHFLRVTVIAVGHDRWKEVQQRGAFRERCSIQLFHWKLVKSDPAEGWVLNFVDREWSIQNESCPRSAATPDQPAPCASWLPQQLMACDHLPIPSQLNLLIRGGYVCLCSSWRNQSQISKVSNKCKGQYKVVVFICTQLTWTDCLLFVIIGDLFSAIVMKRIMVLIFTTVCCVHKPTVY